MCAHPHPLVSVDCTCDQKLALLLYSVPIQQLHNPRHNRTCEDVEVEHEPRQKQKKNSKYVAAQFVQLDEHSS